MENEEEKIKQFCSKCNKKLYSFKEPQSYVFLAKDYYSKDQIDSSIFQMSTMLNLEHGKSEDRENLLNYAIQTGVLQAANVCFECFSRIIEEIDNSINLAEETRRDYADNLRSMEEESRASIFDL